MAPALSRPVSAHLDDHLSVDDAPLSSLARKVPAAERTGNLAADAQAKIERDAFVKVIDQLSKQPDLILSTQGWVTSQLAVVPTMRSPKKGDRDNLWTGLYGILGGMPDEFMANLLKSRYEEFTDKIIQSIVQKNWDGLRFCFWYETQLSHQQAFPKEMEDQLIASKTLTHRSDQVGGRLAGFILRGGIRPDGSLNLAVACYTHNFGDGSRAKTVTHNESRLEVPFEEHVYFTKAFELKDNMSDFLATAEYKNTKYLLWEHFPKEAPFLKHRLTDKKAKDLAKLAAEFVKVQSEEATNAEKEKVDSTKTVLEEAKKDKKKAAMASARQKLHSQKLVRQSKRRVKLSG